MGIDGHYTFEGNRYVDGFLIKSMPMTSLMIEGIKPTLDEITLFEGSVDMAAAADMDTEVRRGCAGKPLPECQHLVLRAPSHRVDV